MNPIDFVLGVELDFVMGVEGPVPLFVSAASLCSLCRVSVGGLIAIVLLAIVLVSGGVGDGPWLPGCVSGVASKDLSAAFFDLTTFSPSSIRPATSFCFVSVGVHGICL